MNIRREPIIVHKYATQIRDLTIDWSRVAKSFGEPSFASSVSVSWLQATGDDGDVTITQGSFGPRTVGLVAAARFEGGTRDTKFYVEATFLTGQKSRQTVIVKVRQ